jgi:hypothetical protein
MYNGKLDTRWQRWKRGSNAACCSDYDTFDAFTLEKLIVGIPLGSSSDGARHLLLVGYIDLKDPDAICGDLVDG